jgi:hypothetical protein
MVIYKNVFYLLVISACVTLLNSMDISRSTQDFNRVANSIYFANYFAVRTLKVGTRVRRKTFVMLVGRLEALQYLLNTLELPFQECRCGSAKPRHIPRNPILNPFMPLIIDLVRS